MPASAWFRRLGPWLLGLALLAIVPSIGWSAHAYTTASGPSLREGIGTLALSSGTAFLAVLALWAYGRAPVRGFGELAGPLAGLVLGLLFAGIVANTSGMRNILFDAHYDGPPAPGPLGLPLIVLLPILGAWGARSGPRGSRPLLVAGLAFPSGIAFTILWLGPSARVLDPFGRWAIFALPLAIAGAAAARWLPDLLLRRVTALVLLALLLGGVVWAWPILISMTIPFLGVLAPTIAELSASSARERAAS